MTYSNTVHRFSLIFYFRKRATRGSNGLRDAASTDETILYEWTDGTMRELWLFTFHGLARSSTYVGRKQLEPKGMFLKKFTEAEDQTHGEKLRWFRLANVVLARNRLVLRTVLIARTFWS